MKTTSAHSRLLATIFLAGCEFSVDGSLVRDGATPIEPEDDGGTEYSDAGPPADDGGGPGEDGGGPRADAETPVGDGGNDPDAGTACSEDGDCPDDAYCQEASWVCMPRCSDALGCARFSTEGAILSSMASDGERVYWTTYASHYAQTADLYAWDAAGSPILLSAGVQSPYLLFAIDGYLYLLSDGQLRRIRTQAGAEIETVAQSFTRAWYSETSVYWSRRRVSATELWRLDRTGGAPAVLVRTAEGQEEFVGGDDELVYHWEKLSNQFPRTDVLVEQDVTTFASRREVYTEEYGNTRHTTEFRATAVREGRTLFILGVEAPAEHVHINLDTLDYALNRDAIFDGTHDAYARHGGLFYSSGYAYPDQGMYTSCRYVRIDPATAATQEIAFTPVLPQQEFGSLCASAPLGTLFVYAFAGQVFVKPLPLSGP